MNEFTVFLPTLIMIIQFISHTHNELFNSENILLRTTKNVFIRCVFSQMNLKVDYAKYLIFYGLLTNCFQCQYVAELGRVILGVLT